MRKYVVVAAIYLAFAAIAPAQADKKIENIEDIPVPQRIDGSSFGLDEIRMLIMEGCTEREWIPVYEGGNAVKCSILVRGRHFAEVEIPFSEAGYSILYSDSDQLDYNPQKQTIHRNYNGWVVNLSHMIDRQFREAAAKPAGADSSAAPGSEEDRYDALLKLGDLLDKGLISEEEFEAEKQRLLSRD